MKLLQVFIVEQPIEVPDQEPCEVDICQQLPTSEQLSATCQAEPNRAIVNSTSPHTLVIHIPGTVKGIRKNHGNWFHDNS